MTTAFLFPGQGSQHTGMGETLLTRFPEVVEEADEVLGYSTTDLCLSPESSERLGQTQFTQPALYLVSCLQAKAEQEGGRLPAFAAGHSVGEYAALQLAGAFSFADGLRFVAKRGEIMAKVSKGGMAAVIGLEPVQIQAILADHEAEGVDLANFNSPGQTVISGPSEKINALAPTFKEAGAKLFVILKVSGAFHSRMMKTPAQEFATFIKDCSFDELKFPVISNVEATPYRNIDSISELLTRQIHSAVRWTESIQYLHKQGVTDFLECGPGKVLTKLLRQID